MRRRRQARRSAGSRKRSSKSVIAGARSSANSDADLFAQSAIGLYGQGAWQVRRDDFGAPANGRVTTLETARAAQEPRSSRISGRSTAYSQAIRQVATRNTNVKTTARPHLRVTEGWRELNIDFSCFVGVANALAFEAIVLIAIVAVWLAWSALPWAPVRTGYSSHGRRRLAATGHVARQRTAHQRGLVNICKREQYVKCSRRNNGRKKNYDLCWQVCRTLTVRCLNRSSSFRSVPIVFRSLPATQCGAYRSACAVMIVQQLVRPHTHVNTYKWNRYLPPSPPTAVRQRRAEPRCRLSKHSGSGGASGSIRGSGAPSTKDEKEAAFCPSGGLSKPSCKSSARRREPTWRWVKVATRVSFRELKESASAGHIHAIVPQHELELLHWVGAGKW